MSRKTTQSQFRGTQHALYAICRLAWNSYNEYLSSFARFSEKYTAAYGQAALDAVEAAAKLPDDSVRRSNTTSTRQKLLAEARVCRNNWQALARYVELAYPPEQAEAMKLAAGSDYYRRASGENWNDLSALLTRASEFIAANSTALQMGGKGMPAGFADYFDTAKNTCTALINEYMSTRQNGGKITSAKTDANNAVYATLMDMLKDAKIVFVNDETAKRHFIYSALEKLVKRDTASGLRISVKESGTLLPVTTTTFVFQPGNVTAFVDARGIATIKLPKGVYSYIATTPGFATVYGSNINTTTGVMHRIEILLNKEVAVA